MERLPNTHETTRNGCRRNYLTLTELVLWLVVDPQRRNLTRSEVAVEVEYELTLADGMAFTRYHLTHPGSTPSSSSRFSWVWAVLGLLLLGMVAVSMLAKPPPGKEVAVSAWDVLARPGLAGIIGLLLVPFFFFQRPLSLMLTKRRLRSNKLFFQKRRLVITPEAVTQALADRTLTMAWSSVERVGQTADHAFIYLSKAEALVLPRHAFSRESDFREFVDTARRYFVASRVDRRREEC